MARTVRKSGMKEVPLSEIKDDLSRFLSSQGLPLRRSLSCELCQSGFTLLGRITG